METTKDYISQDSIKKTLNELYDTAIDHAIGIVENAWIGFDGETMFRGKYTNDVFQNMISELKSLKSDVKA